MIRPPTLAAVVLTLNEEKDLARSLQSLSWADELIVIDSGSTDKTRDIALAFGARFIVHIQQPPFLISCQRNWALNNAQISSEWVLFLDADESVGNKLHNSILSAICSGAQYNAYNLTPRYWFLGKWLKRTQGFPNWHPRLLKRESTHFEGGVWESFSSNAVVGYISEPYEHFAFSKGIDSWICTHLRYADWDAESIIAYRSTNSPDSFKTSRSLNARIISSRLLLLRPFLRFAQKYLLQLGILEGYRAFLFCVLMAIYDFFVLIKVVEKSRSIRGLPL